jgi:hypothetical protein
MFKVKYSTVEIRLNETMTVHRTVYAWEVPILQAMHDSVKPVRDNFVAVSVIPAPDTEYNRLSEVYKTVTNDDGSKGPTYVSAVYGNFGPGTQTLRKAIVANVIRLDDSEYVPPEAEVFVPGEEGTSSLAIDESEIAEAPPAPAAPTEGLF